jgi:hypothetical protein
VRIFSAREMYGSRAQTLAFTTHTPLFARAFAFPGEEVDGFKETPEIEFIDSFN